MTSKTRSTTGLKVAERLQIDRVKADTDQIVAERQHVGYRTLCYTSGEPHASCVKFAKDSFFALNFHTCTRRFRLGIAHEIGGAVMNNIYVSEAFPLRGDV